MPFLYYLASEYQERRNLNLFTFKISVEVLSPDEPLFSKTLFSTLLASFRLTDFTEYEGLLQMIKTKIRYNDVNECYYRVCTKPFQIHIKVSDGEEDIEEEEEEEEQLIKANKTFKSDECVIFLINQPNVLFCSCGHIAICVECDEMKSLGVCPVCKTENFIKRMIEY